MFNQPWQIHPDSETPINDDPDIVSADNDSEPF